MHIEHTRDAMLRGAITVQCANQLKNTADHEQLGWAHQQV